MEPYLSLSLVKLSNSYADLFVLKKTKLETKPHGLLDFFSCVLYRHSLIHYQKLLKGVYRSIVCPKQHRNRRRLIIPENKPSRVWWRHARGYFYIFLKAKCRGSWNPYHCFMANAKPNSQNSRLAHLRSTWLTLWLVLRGFQVASHVKIVVALPKPGLLPALGQLEVMDTILSCGSKHLESCHRQSFS